MHSLFSLLLKYRALLLFFMLEGLSALFIVKTNSYHQAALINSSNQLVASTLDASNTLTEYLNLRTVNNQLAEENARLRSAVARQRQAPPVLNPVAEDSLLLQALAQDSIEVIPPTETSQDSARYEQYAFIPAKVVDNTVQRAKNYVTINKGRADGIVPDMGVISPEGVVGKVQDVSEHYALIASVLHTDMFISALVKRSSTLGSLQWKGQDSRKASLNNIPIHINVMQGDTIITSGFSGIYPPGINVGTVSEVRLEEDAAFYDIDVDLSTNFHQLSYIYIVDNHLKNEKDSLEQKNSVAE